MSSINRVTITGRTGQDAKSKAMANGRKQARISVASKRFKDSKGEWQEGHLASGHRVRATADYRAEIPIGSLVFIEGEIQYRDYQRQLESPDGTILNVRWPITEIVCDRITIIERKQQRQPERGAA